MALDLEKASVKELTEVIELFGKAGVVVPEGLTNQEKRREFISAAIIEKGGLPHEVTQDDLERNPAFLIIEEGIGVGEIIFIPTEEVMEEEIPEAPEGSTDDEDAGDDESDEEGEEDVPEAVSTPSVALPEELKYRGAVVLGVDNRIVNGRIYKEVRTALETVLMSEEEFDKEFSKT